MELLDRQIETVRERCLTRIVDIHDIVIEEKVGLENIRDITNLTSEIRRDIEQLCLALTYRNKKEEDFRTTLEVLTKECVRKDSTIVTLSEQIGDLKKYIDSIGDPIE